MPKRTFMGSTGPRQVDRLGIPASGGGRKFLPLGEEVELTKDEAAFVDALAGVIIKSPPVAKAPAKAKKYDNPKGGEKKWQE